MTKLPYFLPSRNAWVINEVCKCGHYKTWHEALFVPPLNGDGLADREYICGRCSVTNCSCDRYTFKDFILFAGDKDHLPIIGKKREGEGGAGAKRHGEDGIEYH